jgi:hypothetical protein
MRKQFVKKKSSSRGRDALASQLADLELSAPPVESKVKVEQLD